MVGDTLLVGDHSLAARLYLPTVAISPQKKLGVAAERMDTGK